MTTFWIIAACFVAGGLLFLLPPLLQRGGSASRPARKDITVSIYRNEMDELESDLANATITPEQYRQARQELERRLLEDVATPPGEATPAAARGGRWVAAVVGVAVPLVAVGIYLKLGNPDAIVNPGQPAGAGAHSAGQITPQQIQAMIDELAARLEKNPNDAEGWAMLARSHAVMGRFNEAVRAYSKLNELVPDNPQVLADYADALAMAQGRRLAGEPVKLIERALKADPNHQKSLALAGSAAFEAKDYKQATAYWERLIKLLPPESESYRSVAGGIAEARALAGGASPQAASQASPQPPRSAAAASIAGKVTLNASLQGKVAPGDTLYVFARAAEGPKMPVAIARLTAAQLPASFTLDDSSAMSPQMKLSSFPEVVVGARISKSGDAKAQSGDLEGYTGPVKVGSNGIQVVIDRVVP